MNTQERTNSIRYEVMSRKPRRNASVYHGATLVSAVIGGCLQMTGGTTEMFIGAFFAFIALGCAYIAYWEEWFVKQTKKINLENELRNSDSVV